MTSGSIKLDISYDDGGMTIHLHTEIATTNDADLQVTSTGGLILEASGPMHTSRGIGYNCQIHMRRSGGLREGAVLKGRFEIDPVSASGSRQAYEFEATKTNPRGIP